MIKEKFEKAIELAKTIDEILYVKDKIETTSQINRRTKAGRELTINLLQKSNERQQRIADTENPF